MRRNSERLAWTVIITSFVIFCILVTFIPIGGWWWVRHAARDQKITLTSTGTAQITRPGRTTAEVNLSEIPVGSTVVTTANSQATLLFTSPDGAQVIASVTIYGNTEIKIDQANTPRFGLSTEPNHLNLHITSGRVRARLTPEATREGVVRLFSSPNAVTVLTVPNANALVDATVAQTIVTVREGEATVVSQSQSRAILVSKGQRTEVTVSQTDLALLPAERNLILNSDFQLPITEGWVTEIRNTPGDITGTVNVVDIGDGRRAANFFRPGTNWGEVALTQEINKDVSDLNSLHLQMDVRIKFQDLWNCGERGTECPLMIKIKYIDTKGTPQEWLKGYFYRFTNSPAITAPLICVECPRPISEHEQVAVSQWLTVDSGDLLDIFREAEVPAAVIKSVTLTAAGHAFDSEVTGVQLLASE